MGKTFASYEEELSFFSAMNEEPSWFLEKRKHALKMCDEFAMPRFQRAKYRQFKLLEQPLGEGQEISGNIPDFVATKNNPVFYQENNVTTFVQLPQELAEQGVLFMDLKEALVTHPELLEKYYMTQAVLPKEDKLTAFHAAFVDNGVFLYVPDNVEIKVPLETIFYQNDTTHAYVKHVLVVAGKNSHFSYLERFISEKGQENKISANIVVEVIAEDGAHIKYAAVDELGENVTAYVNRRGHLKANASIDWGIGVMNGGHVVADFDSDLVGEGSHAELKAVAISSGDQQQIIDTRVTNKAPHTVGHILQHGVVLDHSTLTFNGIGHILKGASHSDAQQESRVLMLSDDARGDANPILLIDDNDVTAGHAASVGQIEAQDLYYLMSRGLRLEDAQHLVIRGFLGSVITAIPVREVQKEFIKVIEGKLHAEI